MVTFWLVCHYCLGVPNFLSVINSSNSYKCAALFEGLSGVDSPVSWIGAMPDALSKTSVQRNKAFISSFGLPVTRKSFLLGNRCSELTANSRCYAIVRIAATGTYRDHERRGLMLHDLIYLDGEGQQDPSGLLRREHLERAWRQDCGGCPLWESRISFKRSWTVQHQGEFC